MEKANTVSVLKPSVCFEVQKIIRISTGEGNCKSYKVQWAPSWISGAHLVGCKDNFEEFERKQTEKEIDIKIMIVGHGSEYGAGLISVNEEEMKATDAEGMETTHIHNNTELRNDSQCMENTNGVPLNTNFFLNQNYTYLKSRGRTNSNSLSGNILSQDSTIQNTTEHHQTHSGQIPKDVEHFDKEYTTRYVVKSEPLEHLNVMDNNCETVFNMPPVKMEADVFSRREMNDEMPEIKNEEKETFNSNIYNNLLTSDSYLEVHPGISNTTQHCPICGSKTHNCAICGRTFFTKTHLQRHSLIHNKGKHFPCKICRMMFPNGVKLQAHLQTHMRGCGDKPHHCAICDRTFATKTQLKRHALIHNKGNNFPCDICKMLFNDDAKLQVHLQMHADCPYQCPTCSKMFSASAKLKRHCKEVHRMSVCL